MPGGRGVGDPKWQNGTVQSLHIYPIMCARCRKMAHGARSARPSEVVHSCVLETPNFSLHIFHSTVGVVGLYTDFCTTVAKQNDVLQNFVLTI